MAALCLVAGFSAAQAGPGTRGFATATHIATGAGPSDVAAGFLDDDTHIDLVVANNRARSLTVLLGNGDGTFREPRLEGVVEQPDTLETTPIAVAIGRMDEDERNDIVVAFDEQGTIGVYLNDGDGTFSEVRDGARSTVGPGPVDLVLADLDIDGVLDVVSANAFDDSLSVLLGFGDGTLQSERIFPVGTGPCSVGAGDFDRDGYVDLVASLTVDKGFALLINKGLIDEPIGIDFGGFCFGDCNADGEVTVDELVRGVNIALGNFGVELCEQIDLNGDREVTVDELVRAVNSSLDGCGISTVRTGFIPAGLVVRDVDADDIPDVVLADEGSDRVSIVYGRGNGTFNVPAEFSIGRLSRGLAVTDLDNDSTLDVIATSPADDLLSALYGSRASGEYLLSGLQTFAVHDSPSGALNCGGVTTADVNGDGFADAITANEDSGDISILLNSAAPVR